MLAADAPEVTGALTGTSGIGAKKPYWTAGCVLLLSSIASPVSASEDPSDGARDDARIEGARDVTTRGEDDRSEEAQGEGLREAEGQDDPRGAGSARESDVGDAAAQDDRTTTQQGADVSFEPEPSGSQRALAAGVALVPGVLVHGAGSFVLGRTQTAGRLLLLQGIGLGLLGIGAGTLFATGAARDFAGPAVILTAAGSGLFLLSTVADLYSVLTPRDGLGFDPGWVPHFEAELGYRYVYDPQFAYRNFLVNSLHGRVGRVRLSPSVWSSLENANQRSRVEFAYRFTGPLPGTVREQGSYVEAEAAFTNHRYGFEDFQLNTIEASLNGRWDLSTYDPYLAGAFIDFGVGFANQLHHFGSGVFGPNSFRLLLAHFGLGMYLGDQTPHGGYVRVYYDHRHDGYVAGLLMSGVGSGAIGHIGVDAVYYLTRRWGLKFDGQVGSAALVGLSGLFRYGGEP